MKFLLSALGLGVAAAVGPAWQQLQGYTFENYVNDFNMTYSEEQLATRKSIFDANFRTIVEHNMKNSTYKMNVNQFTALTEVEMAAFKGYNAQLGRQRKATLQVAQLPKLTGPLPTSIDWRSKGAVTDVKNQEMCGSCWAFASTETIESHVQIATGKLLELSPQQITACTPNLQHCGGTGGCSGAIAELAFDYVHTNGGLATEENYPYTAGSGVTGQCKKNVPPAATVSGHVKLTENNQDDLMNAVANIGPIAISVDASWGGYAEGIYDGCSKDATIDHAVQLVGYGEEAGTKYWIVRNSWGSGWGENGYIRLKRFDSSDAYCGTDRNPADGSGCSGGPSSVPVCGMCGILYDTSYPTGAKLVNGEEKTAQI
eukprot:CAMPEP_0175097548 /NCGR_PEP_ID=MMETSP0086_2-20121207/5348_1 /TAXON_ID=136419 /ORGANISM="Unknown Unknown, Strain D1" /LENGTH=371 /DNA_ID=CAMNT_0016371071 /DNA_START=39 /DNA_END=1154 /DNA_ORIENTATION=-